MKKFALMGSVAVAAAMFTAPTAQAAGSPYFPNGAASVNHWGDANPLYFSETVYWCDHGQPEWATAVKISGTPRVLTVTESRSFFADNTWTTPTIGNQWVVLAGHPGARMDSPGEGNLAWSGTARVSVPGVDSTLGDLVTNDQTPTSCKGLPTAPPALGQAPGMTTPTNPPTSTKSPTKTSTPPTKTSNPPTKTSTSAPSNTSTKTTTTSTTSTGNNGGGTSTPTNTSHGGGTTVTSTATSTAPVHTGSNGHTGSGTVHNNGGGTVQPSHHSGPPVQTDYVGGNNALPLAVGAGLLTAAAAGGVMVAARRRD